MLPCEKWCGSAHFSRVLIPNHVAEIAYLMLQLSLSGKLYPHSCVLLIVVKERPCSEMCTMPHYTKHPKTGKFCTSQLPDSVLLHHSTDQQLRDSAPHSRVPDTIWRVSARLKVLVWPGGWVRIVVCTISGGEACHPKAFEAMFLQNVKAEGVKMSCGSTCPSSLMWPAI